jgi:hypothetical protein
MKIIIKLPYRKIVFKEDTNLNTLKAAKHTIKTLIAIEKSRIKQRAK